MPLGLRLILVCLLVTAAAATSASAADHMWMGFQDDPALRWRHGRSATFSRIQRFNVSVVRTTVYWSRMAPRRPESAANPFDRAYRFADLDEFVRNAATRGIAVMLTIWGTPRLGKRRQERKRRAEHARRIWPTSRVPSRVGTTARIAGLPAVQFYGVWNEPNLGLFLSPQYTRKGKPVSPFIYARLYRAAYAGIKAGNPAALVGIGETAPRGRVARWARPASRRRWRLRRSRGCLQGLGRGSTSTPGRTTRTPPSGRGRGSACATRTRTCRCCRRSRSI